MVTLYIVPRAGEDMKALLKATERKLRGRTTFVRDREGVWSHKKYKGKVHWKAAHGGALSVDLRPYRDEPVTDLLGAFMGYLDRHLHDEIETIVVSVHAR